MTVQYDEKVIRDAINTASSMSEAARLAGMSDMTFRRIAKRLGIYLPNQGRKGVNGPRGNSSTKLKPLEEWLQKGTKISGQVLKRRLIAAGLKSKDECEICGQLPFWNNKPLVLQLDHINGDHTDNRLENLRIICGHCHSQTTTFAGRNIKRILPS